MPTSVVYLRGDKDVCYTDMMKLLGLYSHRGLQGEYRHRPRSGAGGRERSEVKVKVDKTLVASVALHVLVLGWGLVSFSSKAFEMLPEESVPVDVISADQLAKVMAGMKTGKKENPKPLVEKVAEAKPVEDAVGKITEKAPVVTDTAPPPQPKVEEKPVEKKPDPPKPVAESQAEGRAEADREEAGSAQGRSDRRSHEEGREEAAAEAGARPPSRRSRRSRRPSAPSTSRRSQHCSTSAIRPGRP